MPTSSRIFQPYSKKEPCLQKVTEQQNSQRFFPPEYKTCCVLGTSCQAPWVSDFHEESLGPHTRMMVLCFLGLWAFRLLSGGQSYPLNTQNDCTERADK